MVTMLLVVSPCESVACASASGVTLELISSCTTYTPICPGISDAEITVALAPDTSAETSANGALAAGPVYFAPSTIADSPGSGITEQKLLTTALEQINPSPVA